MQAKANAMYSRAFVKFIQHRNMHVVELTFHHHHHRHRPSSTIIIYVHKSYIIAKTAFCTDFQMKIRLYIWPNSDVHVDVSRFSIHTCYTFGQNVCWYLSSTEKTAIYSADCETVKHYDAKHYITAVFSVCCFRFVWLFWFFFVSEQKSLWIFLMATKCTKIITINDMQRGMRWDGMRNETADELHFKCKQMKSVGLSLLMHSQTQFSRDNTEMMIWNGEK